ncbi:MAG: glycosyltransferase [Planctomycetaceae bacterium]|nr:glycosyltransferase [Planctomycetaceae bacterium]
MLPCTISVVLPVYNNRRYLRDAVDSILSQTYSDFELLVFDDGSTDGSLQLLQEFARKDSRLLVYERSHCGYTPHLNEGIKIARGQFVARMDSDDICFPKRFETQVAFLNQHPGVIAVGSSVELIDEYGDPYSRMIVPQTHEEIDARHLNGGGGTMPHPSVMMRREAVLKVGAYQPQFEPAEDLDLWLRLAEVGKLANLAEPLLRYRVHAAMISQAKADKQSDQVQRILEETCRRRGIEPQYHFDQSHLTNSKSIPSDLMRSRMQKALGNGFPQTAFRYALRRLRKNPVSPVRWHDLLRAGYAALKAS